jgi:hypothetical protein
LGIFLLVALAALIHSAGRALHRRAADRIRLSRKPT